MHKRTPGRNREGGALITTKTIWVVITSWSSLCSDQGVTTAQCMVSNPEILIFSTAVHLTSHQICADINFRLQQSNQGLFTSLFCFESCVTDSTRVFTAKVLVRFQMSNFRQNIAGCVGSCAFSDDLAFGGLFIVKPEFRCKGIGQLLWDRRLQYLKGMNANMCVREKRLVVSVPCALYVFTLLTNRTKPCHQRGFGTHRTQQTKGLHVPHVRDGSLLRGSHPVWADGVRTDWDTSHWSTADRLLGAAPGVRHLSPHFWEKAVSEAVGEPRGDDLCGCDERRWHGRLRLHPTNEGRGTPPGTRPGGGAGGWGSHPHSPSQVHSGRRTSGPGHSNSQRNLSQIRKAP